MEKLNSNTLVLNRSWLAVQVCSVKRAISLVYQGVAKIVDEDFQVYDFEDWSEVSQHLVEESAEDFIFTPGLKIKIPRVIVLLFYDKLPKREVKFSRKNIFERDAYTCQYCGIKPPNKSQALRWLEKNQLNLDHVVPKSRGGKTTWANVVASCYKCNAKKDNKLLQELGWKLRKEPGVPSWEPSIRVNWKTHKQWINFMDIAYWNVELDKEPEDEPISE